MLNLNLLKEKILERCNDEVSLKVRREDKDDLFLSGVIKSSFYSSSTILVGFRITANGYVDIRFNFSDYVPLNLEDLVKVNTFNAENYSFLTLYIVNEPDSDPFLELRGTALSLESEEAVINMFSFALRELGQEHIRKFLHGILYF